jgi:cytochrome c oxidase subunit II
MPTIFLRLGIFQPAKWGIFNRRKLGNIQPALTINCHAVAGTAANGRFGPDLTHLMSRDTLASGAVANATENLRRWIQNPAVFKPGSKMPSMGLSDTELSAVTQYLETLR